MRVATDNVSVALRAISDPNRRKILTLLGRKGKHFAQDLEPFVKLAQPTISHHMKQLKRAGLVTIKKAGTYVAYSRNEPAIRKLRQRIKLEI